MLQTVTLIPDGETDFEGFGDTADANVANRCINIATTRASGYQQTDELFVGQIGEKFAAPAKWTSFARFRLDAMPANFLPRGVRFKLTAALDQDNPPGAVKQQLRLGMLGHNYRTAYQTPAGANAGGFNSANYALGNAFPHISGCADTAADDSLIAGATLLSYVPQVFELRDFLAGNTLTIGSGTGGPFDVTETADFPGVLAIYRNIFAMDNFGIALDPLGMTFGVSDPTQGVYLVSKHAAAGAPIELRITYEDHFPEITSAAPSPSLLLGELFQFTPTASHSNPAAGAPAWTISSFPTGGASATIDGSTGLFSWTPTGPGLYAFTIRATTMSEAFAPWLVTSQPYFVEQTFTVNAGAGPLSAIALLEEQVAAGPSLEDQVEATAALDHTTTASAALEEQVEATAALDHTTTGKAALE